MKSSTIRKIVSVIITLLFLVYLYFNWSPIINAIKDVRPGFFGLAIIGQVIAQIANSFMLRSSLTPLGVRLGRFEAFKVTVVSSFVNFFTPVVGGASAKAVYLKSKHGLAYSSFAGALYANYVVMFLISFIFGFVGVLAIPYAIKSDTGIALALFLVAGILGSALFIAFGHQAIRVLRKIPVKNRLIKKFLDKLQLVNEGWDSIKKDKRSIIGISMWSVGVNGGLMIIYWAATASIGISASFGAYMIFAALASVSLLFNLTPGSIGVRESLYGSVYKITRINIQQVVAFSFVDRAAQLIVLGAAWMLFGNSILKGLSKRTEPSHIPPSAS